MRKNIAITQALLKYAFLIIVLSGIACSCKPKAICKTNCKSLEIDGKILNRMTNEPVSNIPLILEWHRSIGWFNEELVTKLKSGDDGSFKTTVSIDSSKFSNDYHLVLMLGESNKYLTDVDNYGAGMNGNSESANFTNLLFTVYPKVPLTIKFKRTQKDDFGTLNVNCYFTDTKSNWVIENGVPGNISSEITVFTCPDVFTKIRVSKTKNFNDVNTIDSIKCSKDENNVYTVNY